MCEGVTRRAATQNEPLHPRASAPAPGSVEAVVRARLSRAPLVQRQAAAAGRRLRARAVPTPVASKPAARPAFRRPVPQAAVTQGQILLEALTAQLAGLDLAPPARSRPSISWLDLVGGGEVLEAQKLVDLREREGG